MEIIVIVIFCLGYLAIAFEHPLKINKTASALLTGVACWTVFVLSSPGESILGSEHFADYLAKARIDMGDRFLNLTQKEIFRGFVTTALSGHLAKIAEILFFLMGAMTIVELVDAHQGFRVITDRITTREPRKLLWAVCWITFFLSSVLDNLTTTIVMVSLIRRLIPDTSTRWFFAGMVIIAANAGGAWTPIGDVTTTMLWIGGQITTVNIMQNLFVPSVMCMLAPLLLLTFTWKGELGEVPREHTGEDKDVGAGNIMLLLGLGALISVPVFKTFTHLPPYVGMLAGVGILWVISELRNPELDEAVKKKYTVAGALSRIDVPSVLFFLGILLAVGALESVQILHHRSMEKVIRLTNG